MSRNTVRKHFPRSTGKTTVTQTTQSSGAGGDVRTEVTATVPTEPSGKPKATAGPVVSTMQSSQPLSSSEPQKRTITPHSSKENHRRRKGKGKDVPKEDVVSAEGASSIGSSAAKPEESSAATTIPPVLQKKSQSRRRNVPQSSYKDLNETISANDTLTTSTTDANTKPVAKVVEDSLPPPLSSSLNKGTDVNTSTPPQIYQRPRRECVDFILGRCQKGDTCERIHVPHDPSECFAFKFGTCPRGYKCPRPHIPVRSECVDFSRGKCDLGEKCRRLHVPPPSSTTTSCEPKEKDDSDTSSSSVDSTPPSTPRPQKRMIRTAEESPSSSVQDVLTLNTDSSPSAKASTRQLAKHDESGRLVCQEYLADTCKQGVRCPFAHPPRYQWIKYLPRSDEVCEEYIEGRCFLGENCWRRHPSQCRPTSTPILQTLPPPFVQPATAKKSDLSTLPQEASSNTEKQSSSPPILKAGVNRPDSTSGTTASRLPNRKKLVSRNTPSDTSSQTTTQLSRPVRQAVTKSMPDNVAATPAANTSVKAAGADRVVEEGTERLLGLLRQSVDDWHTKSQTLRQHVKDTVSSIENRTNPGSSATRPVPDVPPGLRLDQDVLRPSNEGNVSNGPPTMSLRVLDAVEVLFGPGFAVKQVVTGFESRVLFLKNVPSRIPSSRIREALVPFGEVLNIHIPEKLPEDSAMTVKATFVDHNAASAAARALDGCTLFKARVAARLASERSTSLGKGNVRDGDVLLEFPAPCRDAFVGYPTLERARLATEIAYRAQMGDLILSASIYSGLPAVGPHNVRFCGLPPDTQAHELTAFGSNTGVMFTRPNYTSLDDALKALQAKLEHYGELTSVTVISPPFENQTIRAWAHFATPTAADDACGDLNGRRPWYFGHGKISAQHVVSITYQLPKRVFDVLVETLHDLRSHVYTTAHRCDITFQTRSRDRTGSVGVKLSAETLPTLTKLKTSFEAILRGEVVRFDGRAAWDSFFARPSGAAFIAALEADHPQVIIQVDTRKSCIRLFGSPRRTWRARTKIQEQMVKLHTRKVHSITLDGTLLGLFMNSDLLKLQQELGTDNVYIDSRTMSLKVRGNQDAVQVARLIIQQARRRHVLARKQPGQNSCPICLDDVSLPVTLDCGHTWCKNCLTSYLLAAIDTKSFPLLCLGNGARCSQPVPLKIAQRLLSSEDFHRLTHASFLAYIHSRPTEFHYCPTPDCPQVYRTAPPDTVLQCPSCLVRICGNCHIEHHEGKSCPDPEKEELRLFEEWSAGRDVKRCPECKTFIERDAGCNHMTCTRCRTHICWVCLETFAEAARCYDHMRVTHGGIGV